MNLQDELKSLKERIAELEELTKEEQEFPKDGDVYWFINTAGGSNWVQWHDTEIDNKQLSFGNAFKTKDEAEFAVEKLKVEAELRKFSEPWNLEKTQYSFSFDWECGKFELEFPDYNQYPNSYYFDSISALDLAIESVGEERIKKYIFGVEG